jgi:hypothetical protein
MQKDTILRGTPIPLFYRADTGLQVEAYVQHSDFPGEALMVSLTEIPTAAGHIKVYVGTYVPNETGWYTVTYRLFNGGVTLGSDASRFYSYSEAEQASGSIGEPVLQELSVKVGDTATVAYRGIAGLSVAGKIVHESEVLTPETGLSLLFSGKPAPAGFKPMYLASFVPTREGKHFVYIKTNPVGGEALVIVSAFRTLPYNRAAGSIKSTATSTVL